jgi:serralysin
LAGNRIIGSPGDDVLLGGAGYNIFVFKGTFGHDTVADWSRLNKLAFAFEPNLRSYADVMRDSHISHGEFVFVDPNNPNNTVTITAIDEKADLRPSELLFLHH